MKHDRCHQILDCSSPRWTLHPGLNFTYSPSSSFSRCQFSSVILLPLKDMYLDITFFSKRPMKSRSDQSGNKRDKLTWYFLLVREMLLPPHNDFDNVIIILTCSWNFPKHITNKSISFLHTNYQSGLPRASNSLLTSRSQIVHLFQKLNMQKHHAFFTFQSKLSIVFKIIKSPIEMPRLTHNKALSTLHFIFALCQFFFFLKYLEKWPIY